MASLLTFTCEHSTVRVFLLIYFDRRPNLLVKKEHIFVVSKTEVERKNTISGVIESAICDHYRNRHVISRARYPLPCAVQN